MSGQFSVEGFELDENFPLLCQPEEGIIVMEGVRRCVVPSLEVHDEAAHN